MGGILTVAALNNDDLYDTVNYRSYWLVLSETSLVFYKSNILPDNLLFESSRACLPENDLLGMDKRF